MSQKSYESNENEKKIEVNRLISKNLNYLMKVHGYSQNNLSNLLRENGCNIGQGTISKYMRLPEKNFISIAVIIELSKIFEISVDDFVKKDLENNITKSKSSLPNKNEAILNMFNDENLITDPNSRAFTGYFNKYYCYLFPTISSESRPLTGTLEFKKENNFCKVTFDLDTNKINPSTHEAIIKHYEGILVISEGYGVCYCILKSDDLGEISFLLFRYFKLSYNPLDCRMSEVLTVSASDSRYPTVQRFFFSREKLLDNDIDKIMPHLHLNNSEILISKDSLSSIKKNFNFNDKIFSEFIEKSEKLTLFKLREDDIQNTFKNVVHKKKMLELKSAFRKEALSYRYNKVSKKLDANTRDFLLSLGYFQSIKK